MDRNRWLYLLCLAQIGTMLVTMNYSAVLPMMQQEWSLTNAQAGMIFSAYQIGYIILVIILSTLTDFVDTKKIYVYSALWGGIASILFCIFARGFISALVLRCLTGFGLAGTYMPGLKIVTSKFNPEERGKAIGFYVGSFSIGMAASTLITGSLTSLVHWRLAFFFTSIGPVIAGLIASRIMEEMPPEKSEKRTQRDMLNKVFSNIPLLVLVIAYAAHEWELFGMRNWIVTFLVSVFDHSVNNNIITATSFSAIVSSLIIGMGGLSTAVAGMLSDRLGRVRTILVIMLASSACSFIIGWMRSLPAVLVFIFCLVYGFFVTAESSVLSTTVTEKVPISYLGTAMAFQSFVGWASAGISPVVFGVVLDWSNPVVGPEGLATVWGPAFSLLGFGAIIGPLFIILFYRKLHRNSS